MSHHSRVPLSLEFFPAKNPENAAKLRSVRENLYPLGPEFCSVTYGAGGSTQQGTFGTLREMLAEGANAASHFSCIGASKATVREQLAELRAMGVRRIVALRKMRGLSQRQLGAKMDSSRTWISKLERNGCMAQLTSLYRLARAFEVPVGALIEPDETMAFAWVAVKGLSRHDRADLLAWLKSRTPKVTA